MKDLTGNFAGGLYGLALLRLITAVVRAFFLHIPQPGLAETPQVATLTPLSHDLLRASEKERVQYLALMADQLSARASVQGKPRSALAGGRWQSARAAHT